eukprot:2274182-Rhodomonas_salina.2
MAVVTGFNSFGPEQMVCCHHMFTVTVKPTIITLLGGDYSTTRFQKAKGIFSLGGPIAFKWTDSDITVSVGKMTIWHHNGGNAMFPSKHKVLQSTDWASTRRQCRATIRSSLHQPMRSRSSDCIVFGQASWSSEQHERGYYEAVGGAGGGWHAGLWASCPSTEDDLCRCSCINAVAWVARHAVDHS